MPEQVRLHERCGSWPDGLHGSPRNSSRLNVVTREKSSLPGRVRRSRRSRVEPDRRTAGRQAQHRRRLGGDESRHAERHGAGHGVVVFEKMCTLHDVGRAPAPGDRSDVHAESARRHALRPARVARRPLPARRRAAAAGFAARPPRRARSHRPAASAGRETMLPDSTSGNCAPRISSRSATERTANARALRRRPAMISRATASPSSADACARPRQRRDQRGGAYRDSRPRRPA